MTAIAWRTDGTNVSITSGKVLQPSTTPAGWGYVTSTTSFLGSSQNTLTFTFGQNDSSVTGFYAYTGYTTDSSSHNTTLTEFAVRTGYGEKYKYYSLGSLQNTSTVDVSDSDTITMTKYADGTVKVFINGTDDYTFSNSDTSDTYADTQVDSPTSFTDSSTSAGPSPSSGTLLPPPGS